MAYAIAPLIAATHRTPWTQSVMQSCIQDLRSTTDTQAFLNMIDEYSCSDEAREHWENILKPLLDQA